MVKFDEAISLKEVEQQQNSWQQISPCIVVEKFSMFPHACLLYATPFPNDFPFGLQNEKKSQAQRCYDKENYYCTPDDITQGYKYVNTGSNVIIQSDIRIYPKTDYLRDPPLFFKRAEIGLTHVTGSLHRKTT